MDPQHRLLLEAGYMATHGASQRRGELLSRDVGIFVGIMNTDFASIAGSESVYAATGTQVSIASGRLAFALGTQGPCATIDTACSSALVALNAATVSLCTSDSALVAAANLLLLPFVSLLFVRAGMLSVDGRRPLSVPVSGLAILAVLSGAGFLRLSDTPGATVPGVMLRIVQPNIAQRDKWRPDRRAPNYARHIEMSAIPAVAHAITHVIWPETAAPFSVPTDAVRRRLMRRAIPPGGLLITGTPRFERSGGRVSGAWNSLAVVDERTKVIDVYDKHHLVPLGEYVPFRDILPIEKVTAGSLDFTAGSGLRTLRLPGLPPVSPLICYEAIFPGAVARSDDRPAVVEKALSDFGGRGGFPRAVDPHQHDDHGKVAGFYKALNRRIKIPVASLEKGVQGTLQSGFQDLG